MNVGGGICLIKPAKLYMCMQTHYKHNEDGHTAPGVRGHGSLPLSHSGNVVTKIGLHTYISDNTPLMEEETNSNKTYPGPG